MVQRNEQSATGPTLSEHGDAAAWIEQAARNGATRAEALAAFDRLPPVQPEDMTGRWRGGGLHTGHRLDGLLEAHGWYGKAFEANGDAHPLLFRNGNEIAAIDPRWFPVGAVASNRVTNSAAARTGFSIARAMVRTRRPQARIRLVTWRGVASAAMIYDRQPIIDLFRQVGPDMLLGLMDMRGQEPFFFTLRRED